MRSVRMACGALLVVGVFAAVAAAQGAPPTVAVTVGKGVITPQPAGPIAAGPTRFEFTRTGKGDVEAILVTLRPGVSLDQLRKVAASDAALGLIYIEAAAPLSDATPKRALTVDLRANVTYVLVSMAGNSFAFTELATTGTANGAQAPAPDATIRMVDYGFRGSATLPRNGVIRVSNQGDAFHFALAFPVRKNATNKRVGRALRSGSEKAIGRVAAGQPVEVQDVISPQTTNDNEVKFSKAGRYALVCFFGEHNKLGMYRVVKVR
jgi:hypothetical protein